MPNQERLVKQNGQFARLLDANCDVCDFENNQAQLRSLAERKRTHSEEQEVVESLIAGCEQCLEEKDPLITIKQRFSCLWR